MKTPFPMDMEAEKIYYCIFRSAPPSAFIRRFAVISEKINQNTDAPELENYYRIIQQVQDLEALEYACRIFRHIPLLPLKFRAAVFLAEVMPENHSRFVNERMGLARGLFWITVGVVRSFYKLVKGSVLLRGIHA